MPTFVHDDPEFIRYSICHIETVKVIMQDLSQAVVKLSCVTCVTVPHILSVNVALNATICEVVVFVCFDVILRLQTRGRGVRI